MPATAPHSLYGPAAGQAPGRCRKDGESLQPSAHTGSRFMAQVSQCHSCQLRTCLCRGGSEGSTAQDLGGLGTHGTAHPLGSKENISSAHLARRKQPTPQQEGTSRTHRPGWAQAPQPPSQHSRSLWLAHSGRRIPCLGGTHKVPFPSRDHELPVGTGGREASSVREHPGGQQASAEWRDLGNPGAQRASSSISPRPGRGLRVQRSAGVQEPSLAPCAFHKRGLGQEQTQA